MSTPVKPAWLDRLIAENPYDGFGGGEFQYALQCDALTEGRTVYSSSRHGQTDDVDGLLEVFYRQGYSVLRHAEQRVSGHFTLIHEEGYAFVSVAYADSDEESVFGVSDAERGDVSVDFDTLNHQVYKDLQAAVNRLVKKRQSSGKVYTLIQTQRGFQLQNVGNAGEELIPDNYTPTVADDFDYLVEQFALEKPRGRIAILDGSPGTGKTYYVRALLHALPEATFIVLPVHLVTDLASPALVNTLIEEKHNTAGPMILLLEDADGVLVNRGADNMSGLASLLNLSDGLVGKLLDLRVVATTNAKLESIDKAVRRPGRLLRRVEFKPLSVDHAVEVAKREKIRLEPGKDEYTLAEIYSGETDNYDTKTTVGFTP